MVTSESMPAPMPSVRRLPIYLRFLKVLRNHGRDVVSCTHLADEFGLTTTQVRKDLAITGIVGRPKIGYVLHDLVDAIETFLGWRNTTDAFLIGAGRLGGALMGYEGFRDPGFNIIAAFDSDPAKVGTQIHGREVFALDKLPDLADRMHVKIAVLTVPADAAQAAADLAVMAGVRAIWNFTPATLTTPESIVVENVRLSASLAALTQRLRAMLAAENES